MIRIEHILEPLTIVIDRTPRVHDQSEAIDAAWLDLCVNNPRYFNGEMLAFEHYDPKSGVISARIEQYKHHAVRETIDLGISLLALTTLLCAPDQDQGVPVILLGKRSSEAHGYGGLWELGPSGGVDVPNKHAPDEHVPDEGNTITPTEILGELAREVEEEIGVRVDDRPGVVRALVHDDGVGSTDIAIEVMLDHIPEITRGWEYTQTRWVTLDELVAWASESPDDLVPTTVSLARFMHETRC